MNVKEFKLKQSSGINCYQSHIVSLMRESSFVELSHYIVGVHFCDHNKLYYIFTSNQVYIFEVTEKPQILN